MTEKAMFGEIELWHGDCRDILPTINSVDTVITDPPYGMMYQSNHRTVSYDVIANDDTMDMLLFACNIAACHSKYIFCRWDAIKEVPTPKSFITWVKNNWSMGDLKHEHARQTENILFYPGRNHRFPCKRPTDFIINDRSKNEYHPTEKPINLMEKIINWTEGVILDPFMGSGTTGAACVNLGRKFIGIEKERKYFDIACERISRAQSQGRLFD